MYKCASNSRNLRLLLRLYSQKNERPAKGIVLKQKETILELVGDVEGILDKPQGCFKCSCSSLEWS